MARINIRVLLTDLKGTEGLKTGLPKKILAFSCRDSQRETATKRKSKDFLGRGATDKKVLSIALGQSTDKRSSCDEVP